jgi:hypothetical protein
MRHAFGTRGRIGLEHPGDQRPDAQVDRTQIGHLAALLQDRRLAAAHVDRLAVQRFDQHEPEAVDVGLRLHVAAEQPELLRRDIVVLACKTAADDGAVAQLRRARDSKVDNLGACHVAARNHDVVGGDIAVDDAVLMRGVQTGGDALEQGAHRLISQRFAADQIGKRLSLHELHRQIRTPEHRLDREDVIADDCLMMHIVQRGGLTAKQAQRGFVPGIFWMQDLDRDRISSLDRMALVDLAHAAGGDEMIDLVDAVEARAR